MKKELFQTIWNRVTQNEGQTFHTKTGLEFTYKIDGNSFFPSRTNRNIAKSNFEQAYNLMPIDSPSEINYAVQGPAYIWAVLNDKRIIK